MDKINPAVLANAARRGTKVHQICEGIVNGIGEIDVDDETRPYVHSFNQWWDLGHDVIEVEKRFFCDQLMITGQVDLILQTPDGCVIVDLKTSYRPSKTWQAQGSAYAWLAKKEGYDVKKIIFLHLKKNGKPAKEYEYPVDDGFFLDIYRVWKHFYG